MFQFKLSIFLDIVEYDRRRIFIRYANLQQPRTDSSAPELLPLHTRRIISVSIPATYCDKLTSVDIKHVLLYSDTTYDS